MLLRRSLLGEVLRDDGSTIYSSAQTSPVNVGNRQSSSTAALSVAEQSANREVNSLVRQRPQTSCQKVKSGNWASPSSTESAVHPEISVMRPSRNLMHNPLR